ncbi:MAG: hypothetical protein WAO08_09980 [Hyphomicrobiaceae bacterium]
MNLGGEAILEGILRRLRATVPGGVSSPAGHAWPAPGGPRNIASATDWKGEITPEIEDLDPFVLGCGGIRYDDDAETYLRKVFLAYELGVPVILNAISADADVKACR